jgi:6-phosphogluconolactonase (cycloisomerase 2 family)
MSRGSSTGIILVCIAFGIGALALAANGQSAWQTLVFLQVIFDGAPGGVDGLDKAHSVASSPDGKHVYVVGYEDDAVSVFSRDPSSGTLTFVEFKQDGVDGVDGLWAPYSVALSPDGKNVYVAGSADDAVAVFSRDSSTGALTFVQVVKDTDSGVDGLNGAVAVAVSPDGENVYVSSVVDNAVTMFIRKDSTGALTFKQVLKDTDPGIDGLDWPESIAVSLDGKHVYVAGYDDDSVAVFNRKDTSGQLTFQQVVKDGDPGVSGGLDGARSVAVSPDGGHVYVAGYTDDAMVVFDRNSSTGELALVEAVFGESIGACGLNGVHSVVVSPNGQQVYAAADAEDAAVVFSRNTATGRLTCDSIVRDNSGGVDGLDGARSVAVSPDGRHVYVASYFEDALAVFLASQLRIIVANRP